MCGHQKWWINTRRSRFSPKLPRNPDFWTRADASLGSERLPSGRPPGADWNTARGYPGQELEINSPRPAMMVDVMDTNIPIQWWYTIPYHTNITIPHSKFREKPLTAGDKGDPMRCLLQSPSFTILRKDIPLGPSSSPVCSRYQTLNKLQGTVLQALGVLNVDQTRSSTQRESREHVNQTHCPHGSEMFWGTCRSKGIENQSCNSHATGSIDGDSHPKLL